MAFKTRNTTARTFDLYDILARSESFNPHCGLGGKLEWTSRIGMSTDGDGFDRVSYQGSYIRCTCDAKHECFQASTNRTSFRISSHVIDVKESPIVIKRRKAKECNSRIP